MPLDTQGFDGLASDIAGMASRMDADGAGAPAPAHPFIRPAYDTRADEAYGIIRDGLRDAIDRL